MERTPTLFDPDAADGVVARFFVGFRAAVAGVGVVWSDRRLLWWSLAPMAMHFALFVALFALFTGPLAHGAGDMMARLLGVAADPRTRDWHHLLASIVYAGAVVLGAVTAFVASIFAANALCDPFFDLLSERTEELYLGRAVGGPVTVVSMLVGIGRELGANLLRLGVWGAGALPLWILSFTFAGVITGPLSVCWTWLFTAYEFMSRSLIRHNVQIDSRFGALFSNKALFLGFGAGAALLSLLPFTAPLIVVSATRTYLALAARGHVASRLSARDRDRLSKIIA
jgi:uncharacterized protein involved in cysteine biosynthesis